MSGARIKGESREAGIGEGKSGDRVVGRPELGLAGACAGEEELVVAGGTLDRDGVLAAGPVDQSGDTALSRNLKIVLPGPAGEVLHAGE